jgi:hypothetical protein
MLFTFYMQYYILTLYTQYYICAAGSSCEPACGETTTTSRFQLLQAPWTRPPPRHGWSDALPLVGRSKTMEEAYGPAAVLLLCDEHSVSLIENDGSSLMQVATGDPTAVAPVVPSQEPIPCHEDACDDEDPWDDASDMDIDTPSSPSSPVVSPFWGSPNEGHVARVDRLQEDRLRHLRALAADDPPDYLLSPPYGVYRQNALLNDVPLCFVQPKILAAVERQARAASQATSAAPVGTCARADTMVIMDSDEDGDVVILQVTPAPVASSQPPPLLNRSFVVPIAARTANCAEGDGEGVSMLQLTSQRRAAAVGKASGTTPPTASGATPPHYQTDGELPEVVTKLYQRVWRRKKKKLKVRPKPLKKPKGRIGEASHPGLKSGYRNSPSRSRSTTRGRRVVLKASPTRERKLELKERVPTPPPPPRRDRWTTRPRTPSPPVLPPRAPTPEGPRPVSQTEWAPEVIERFITNEEVEPYAAARLRRAPRVVQQAVVLRGSLTGSRNPTAVLMTRMRNAEKVQAYSNDHGIATPPVPPQRERGTTSKASFPRRPRAPSPPPPPLRASSPPPPLLCPSGRMRLRCKSEGCEYYHHDNTEEFGGFCCGMCGQGAGHGKRCEHVRASHTLPRFGEEQEMSIATPRPARLAPPPLPQWKKASGTSASPK